VAVTLTCGPENLDSWAYHWRQMKRAGLFGYVASNQNAPKLGMHI